VRFTGEMEIVTALEEGPVEVVNLMARRGAAEIELVALCEPGTRQLAAGTHLVYAPHGECCVRLDAEDFIVPGTGTLRIELTEPSQLALVSGLAVLGSIRLLG
jgi:environmental stress-induced protein Ves